MFKTDLDLRKSFHYHEKERCYLLTRLIVLPPSQDNSSVTASLFDDNQNHYWQQITNDAAHVTYSIISLAGMMISHSNFSSKFISYRISYVSYTYL